jgi:quercetin dioxygenase-like cupin family protein
MEDRHMSSDLGSEKSPAADAQSGQAALVAQMRALLQELHAGAQSIPDSFLEDWPAITSFRSVLPAPLPVLDWLVGMTERAVPLTGSVVRTLVRTAGRLRWSQSYRVPAVSETFLRNYGWTELLGLTGPVASEHLAAGFLMLAPQTHYPPHRHQAEELYVLLAGRALWHQGTRPWTERGPGEFVHHHGDELHAMRTTEQPLLALYVWRGNLKGGAQLAGAQESRGPYII